MAIPSVDELGERLGIVLRDREAVAQAFVHSSYFNENPTLVDGHNERLEFLGDAVIGLVVSRLLYERFPDEDEGFLTARRAALVNRHASYSTASLVGSHGRRTDDPGQAQPATMTQRPMTRRNDHRDVFDLRPSQEDRRGAARRR